uniref:Uncharacterized protein n=1 Tax=Eutreptiella gymnastica TaxID=73025 RepID=A0A7S4GEA6_9EUGL
MDCGIKDGVRCHAKCTSLSNSILVVRSLPSTPAVHIVLCAQGAYTVTRCVVYTLSTGDATGERKCAPKMPGFCASEWLSDASHGALWTARREGFTSGSKVPGRLRSDHPWL